MSDEQIHLAEKFVRAHLREGDLAYMYDSEVYVWPVLHKVPRGGTDATAVVERARADGAERLVNVSDLQMMTGHAEMFDLNVHVDLVGPGPVYDHLELPEDLARKRL